MSALAWSDLVAAEPRLAGLVDRVLAIPMGCTWCVAYDWEGGALRGRGIVWQFRALVGMSRLMPGERHETARRGPVMVDEALDEALARLRRQWRWLRSLPVAEREREELLRSTAAYDLTYGYLLALSDSRVIPSGMPCPRCEGLVA